MKSILIIACLWITVTCDATVEPLFPRDLGVHKPSATANGSSFSPEFLPANGDLLFISEANNVVSNDLNRGLDLYRFVSSSNQINLVSSGSNVWANVSRVVASKDGQVIAFSQTSAGPGAGEQSDVYVKSGDAAPKLLSRKADGTATASVSQVVGMDADGKVLLIRSNARSLDADRSLPQGVFGYYLYEVPTGKFRLVSSNLVGTDNNQFDHAALSPDGLLVIYARASSIFLFNVSQPAAEPRLLMTNRFISTMQVHFVPNENKAYVATDSGLFLFSLPNGQVDQIDTGFMKEVAVSRDGKAAYFSQLRSNIGPVKLVMPGREITTLFGGSLANVAQLKFSPDGKSLYYISSTNHQTGAFYGTPQLLQLEFSTGEIRLISSKGSQPFSKEVVAYDVSQDGQTVALATAAADLVPNDRNKSADIFLLNRATGDLKLVTKAHAQSSPRSLAQFEVLPAIHPHQVSTNFDAVVFTTALALDPSDTNGLNDVYLYERVTGALRFLSSPTNGFGGSGPAHSPAISADGRYVSFAVDIHNQVAPGQPPIRTYLYRVIANQVQQLADSRLQNFATPAYAPFSGNGEYLLSPAVTNSLGMQQVYRMLHLPSGQQWETQSSQSPSRQLLLTGNASWFVGLQGPRFSNAVARFTADYSFLAASQTDDTFLVRNNRTNRLEVVDPNTRTVLASSTVNLVFPGLRAVSADARTAVFYEEAGRQLYYFRVGSDPSRLPLGFFGADYQARNDTQVSLDAAGHHIAYQLDGGGFPGDDNNMEDVFLRNLRTGATILVSANFTGTGTADYRSALPVLNPDGSMVLFSSAAKNLTPEPPVRFYEPYLWSSQPRTSDDQDNDGINDSFEVEEFGSTGVVNATSDIDGDGVSDLAEFHYGSAMNNPTSTPFPHLHYGAAGAVLEVEANSALATQIEYANSLSENAWKPLHGTLYQIGNRHFVEDKELVPQRFYRLVIPR
jgi:Tol biopolymer transport system component